MADTNLTKQQLADSLKKRMLEKSFDKISVIDICEGCGMNRKSFYYHFKDKYDLVNWIFYTDFIDIARGWPCEDGWDLVEMLIGMFYRSQDFYRCALEIEGQNSFRDYFFDSMMPIFHMFLNEISDEDSFIRDNSRYISDAFLAVLHSWLKDGCPQDPRQLHSNIRRILAMIGKSAGAEG